MANEEDFSDNYLILKPEEATLLDIFYLLYSSDLKQRSSVLCPDSQRLLINFKRRWYIFVSLLAQKFLLYMAKPMAMVGSAIEIWLNFVTDNGGLFMLLFNFLTGNLVRPDKTRANFRSLIGNLDLREDLDKNIKPDDNRYYPSLAIMAAKLAYENKAFVKRVIEDHWKMELLNCYSFWNDLQRKRTTHATMLQDKAMDPKLIVVAFRGTDPFDMDAWRTDVDLSWLMLKGVGKVHHGFLQALNVRMNQGIPLKTDTGATKDRASAYYSTKQILHDILNKNENAKFIVTGHSLGGALAIMFVTMLAYHEEKLLLERLEGVYTFGQPRVGDEKFGEFMENKLKANQVKYLRSVYCNDMVPRLPYDDKILSFKHFGQCLYYNSFFYQGKIVKEEPNKNYFNLFWIMPKSLNALWELVRSFIIPYIMGSNYRESWFMKFMRVVGLVIPGLSAHCPQDYVNSTRLGSLAEDIAKGIEID